MRDKKLRIEEAERIRGIEVRADYLGRIAADHQYEQYLNFVEGRAPRLSVKLATRLAASVLNVEDVFLLRSLAMSKRDELEEAIRDWIGRDCNPTYSLMQERTHDMTTLIVLLEEEGWIRWYLGETVAEPNWAIR